MAFHLEGPWLTTTSTKKRSQKRTKAQQLQFELEHREYNREMKRQGRHNEIMTLAEYDLFVRGILSKRKILNRATYQQPKPFHRETAEIPSLPFTGGACVKVADKVYTGSAMKGIGVMHKSNSVPIFSDEEAVEIARMRR